MADSTIQATPAMQIPQTAPMNVATMDIVVLLVRLIKSMREMGCEPYIREQDPEIVGEYG
jgi:hypothetical protein